MSGQRLAGKVAVVTGAGQGVGRGIALALAKEGASIAVLGRTLAKCEKVAAELEALGVEALPLTCEVGDRAQVDEALAAVVEHFGGLDALVNNAQSSHQALLADVTDEDVEECWRSGALGTLYAMQAALPLGRVGDPELDIGRAVVALVSEDLSYLTGETLRLTGGG